jgi:hypothetical protein
MLCPHGMFDLHHLQRMEDVRLTYERARLSGLLYRRTSFPSLALITPDFLDILQLPRDKARHSARLVDC